MERALHAQIFPHRRGRHTAHPHPRRVQAPQSHSYTSGRDDLKTHAQFTYSTAMQHHSIADAVGFECGASRGFEPCKCHSYKSGRDGQTERAQKRVPLFSLFFTHVDTCI